MPDRLFTEHGKFQRHLAAVHRDRFEAGAIRRIRDGSLVGGGKAEMTWEDSMVATMFTDLYYALGGFTVASTVSVSATGLGAGRWQVAFDSWAVRISDYYNWDVNKRTFVPGVGIVEDRDLRALERAGYGQAYDVSAAFQVTDTELLAPMEVELVQ